jgi:hypothetical protein
MRFDGSIGSISSFSGMQTQADAGQSSVAVIDTSEQRGVHDINIHSPVTQERSDIKPIDRCAVAASAVFMTCGFLLLACIVLFHPRPVPLDPVHLAKSSVEARERSVCPEPATLVDITYTESPFATFRLLPNPESPTILTLPKYEASATAIVSDNGVNTSVIAAHVPFYVETAGVFEPWSISITAMWRSWSPPSTSWSWVWWYTHGDSFQLTVYWEKGALCVDVGVCFPAQPMLTNKFVKYTFNVYPSHGVISLFIYGTFVGTVATSVPLNIPGGINFASVATVADYTQHDALEVNHGNISELQIQTIPPLDCASVHSPTDGRRQDVQ